jgi:hypothetical protein
MKLTTRSDHGTTVTPAYSYAYLCECVHTHARALCHTAGSIRPFHTATRECSILRCLSATLREAAFFCLSATLREAAFFNVLVSILFLLPIVKSGGNQPTTFLGAPLYLVCLFGLSSGCRSSRRSTKCSGVKKEQYEVQKTELTHCVDSVRVRVCTCAHVGGACACACSCACSFACVHVW